jgi:hypothetical protein
MLTDIQPVISRQWYINGKVTAVAIHAVDKLSAVNAKVLAGAVAAIRRTTPFQQFFDDLYAL